MQNKEQFLIGKIHKGDKEAFRELYDLYYTSLCRHAYSFVDDRAVAEDIVQDVFFNLWEKRKSLNIENSLVAYLYRTVYYQSMKYLRRKILEQDHLQEAKLKLREAEILYKRNEFPFSQLDQKVLKEEIKTALDNLPEKTRKVFILSRKHELKNKEIAEHLEINLKTVEYHVSKALLYLREKLIGN
ncbi:MAG: RNA polymerase sigma-70 factor [Bacteroidota bacterium]